MNRSLHEIADAPQPVDVPAQVGKPGVGEVAGLRALLDDGVAAGLWRLRNEGGVLVYESVSVSHVPTLRASGTSDHSTLEVVPECVR